MRTLLLATALSAFLCIPRASADAIYSDGLFDNADWSLTLSAGTTNGTAVALQSAVGGNPDNFRNVTHSVTSIPGLVQVFHTQSTFVYDPSVQGAIDSIAWSIDFKNSELGQAAALMFEQGGVFHIADVFVTTSFGTGAWHTHSAPALLEADFGNAADFSASGAPITFGIFTANSGQVGTFTTGYDNLLITVSSTLTGDLDADGFVGINDLNIVLGNWNQSVPPGDPLADPSGDGFVGIEDLNAVLGNWNAGTPPADSQTNIPEPGTLGMSVLCGLIMMARSRRDRIV